MTVDPEIKNFYVKEVTFLQNPELPAPNIHSGTARCMHCEVSRVIHLVVGTTGISLNISALGPSADKCHSDEASCSA